jgi:hypothetical protein
MLRRVCITLSSQGLQVLISLRNVNFLFMSYCRPVMLCCALICWQSVFFLQVTRGLRWGIIVIHYLGSLILCIILLSILPQKIITHNLTRISKTSHRNSTIQQLSVYYGVLCSVFCVLRPVFCVLCSVFRGLSWQIYNHFYVKIL